MIDMLLFLFGVALSFFIGSLPFSYWIVKWTKGKDIRLSGSGNVGATNVFRTEGKALGFTALFLDIFKGFVAVIFIPLLFGAPDFMESFLYRACLGMAAIFGHTWTPFLNWKGGKGVATSAGVFLGLLPVPFFIALCIFLSVFLITRIISVGSLAAAAAFPLAVIVTQNDKPYFWTAFIICSALAGFIFYTHRSNIKRLIKGEEKKLRKEK